jgi:hypothetical protein
MSEYEGDYPYNGQSKAEYFKNFKRVSDIITKANGDLDKIISLSKTQANKITDEYKAINRAKAAKQMALTENDPLYLEVFEIFFQRAYELGSVTKQDYREYRLAKLGI